MTKLTAKQAALKILKKNRKWMRIDEIHKEVQPMLAKKKCQAGALEVRLRELARDGLIQRDWVPGKNYKHYKIA